MDGRINTVLGFAPSIPFYVKTRALIKDVLLAAFLYGANNILFFVILRCADMIPGVI